MIEYEWGRERRVENFYVLVLRDGVDSGVFIEIWNKCEEVLFVLKMKLNKYNR